MNEPTSLDSLFREKLFRVPDYQRGYAWQVEQLKAFWEDLVNLSPNRSHYTGVLTLKQIPVQDIDESEKEFWLVDDHSYRLYHIVDGQQRLTTFVVFLQAFVELFKGLPEHDGQAVDNIYISDSLNVAAVCNNLLRGMLTKTPTFAMSSGSGASTSAAFSAVTLRGLFEKNTTPTAPAPCFAQKSAVSGSEIPQIFKALSRIVERV